METIHLESIAPNQYLPILNLQRRALVLSTAEYAVGDVMILNPFNREANRYMNYDALDNHFYPGNANNPLLAHGIIVEITDVEYLDSDSDQQLVSFKPVNHFLRKHVILAEAESRRNGHLLPQG